MDPTAQRWSAGLVVVLGAMSLALAALSTAVLVPSAAEGASAVLAEGVVAAIGEPSSAVTAEPYRAPERLSETGLYLPDGTIDPQNRPFAPQYPLWTDGAEKARWIRLPDGATIDVSDIDAWRFPPGTTFWKEFAFAGRRVETRMIHLSEGGEWTFATYVWNDQQTDAQLAPETGLRNAAAIAPNRSHSIPGVSDCVNCHASSPAVVLGFNALQLSDDRDPLSPNAEPLPVGALTLGVLDAEGRLDPPRPDLVRSPPRIREADPVARAAIGYLSGNCGGCHNDTGPLARLGLVLLHDVAGEPDAPEPAVATAVDAEGRWSVPGIAPGESRLVAPGTPDHSALLYRMGSRRPSSQMPPLGTVLPDDEAVALVRAWIEGLRAPALL